MLQGTLGSRVRVRGRPGAIGNLRNEPSVGDGCSPCHLTYDVGRCLVLMKVFREERAIQKFGLGQALRAKRRSTDQ